MRFRTTLDVVFAALFALGLAALLLALGFIALHILFASVSEVIQESGMLGYIIGFIIVVYVAVTGAIVVPAALLFVPYQSAVLLGARYEKWPAPSGKPARLARYLFGATVFVNAPLFVLMGWMAS